MDWSVLLQQVVYPALLGLILIIISIALKMLATWLKLYAAKTNNEVLRQIALAAAAEVEQKAAAAEKASEAKWSQDKKKSEALTLAANAAANAGIKADPDTIDHLIESVLGEAKLK